MEGTLLSLRLLPSLVSTALHFPAYGIVGVTVTLRVRKMVVLLFSLSLNYLLILAPSAPGIVIIAPKPADTAGQEILLT